MALEPGQPAPDFTALDDKGKKISLSKFRGKKVLLYFYPKDDTETCTKQACNLNDNITRIKKAGYQVVGVSPDSVKSHAKFRDKYGLKFPLVADEGHSICETYGVWQEKSLYGRTYMGVVRTTFLIDEEGNLEQIIDQVKSSEHADQVVGPNPKKGKKPAAKPAKTAPKKPAGGSTKTAASRDKPNPAGKAE